MKNILILFIAISFVSCSQIDKRGYSFKLSDYKTLKESINNQDDTINAMGYPILTEYLGREEIWIYYSEDVKRLFFFKPKILTRQITTISFGNDHKIKKIKNYDLADQNAVIFSQNYTKVSSPKLKWWKQIFGNIGQIKAN